MGSLKTKNRYLVFAFLVINAFIFWCVTNGFYQFDELEKWLEVLRSFSIFAATLAPLLTISVNGLITPHWKAVLVYWEMKNPLPGSRAFSQLINEDSRIDVQSLKELISQFPTEPDRQNSLWYKMYLKHQNETQISEAHRNWLLLRDIASISFLLIFIFGITALIFGESPRIVMAGYILFLLTMYTVMANVARQYGNTFVKNVLSLESHTLR